MTIITKLEQHDIERMVQPETPWDAVRRRFSGRYQIDPFGLDPQLSDLLRPIAAVAIKVVVQGEEHVPTTGPATIVSNRGFGVFEPGAMGIAVERATGRRLRFVGAPAVPFVGSMTRRFGAIAASQEDVGAALRAGHLVYVSLSQTWLRIDAGMPPHTLMPAITHAQIIPAAVTPNGPFGLALNGWTVRFGPLVTIDEDYDPNDPLAAARFTDAMRIAVRALLAES
jgi:hypothetical protein